MEISWTYLALFLISNAILAHFTLKRFPDIQIYEQYLFAPTTVLILGAISLLVFILNSFLFVLDLLSGVITFILRVVFVVVFLIKHTITGRSNE